MSYRLIYDETDPAQRIKRVLKVSDTDVLATGEVELVVATPSFPASGWKPGALHVRDGLPSLIPANHASYDDHWRTIALAAYAKWFWEAIEPEIGALYHRRPTRGSSSWRDVVEWWVDSWHIHLLSLIRSGNHDTVYSELKAWRTEIAEHGIWRFAWFERKQKDDWKVRQATGQLFEHDGEVHLLDSSPILVTVPEGYDRYEDLYNGLET